ncbi:hypothetical protein BDL97_01G021700 [Sphagnum fallax]|nr:hypothetical protein BDL97_01G021700 [Sphagnum fallax]
MSTTTTTTTISSQTLSKESSSQVDSSANYSTSSSSSYSVTSSQQQQVLGIKDMLSDGAIIFKLKDLSMATKNFHPAKKMGSSVFWGSLHGMDGSGGGGSDFVAEMKNSCSVHHTNLVKLIGGCSNVQHGLLTWTSKLQVVLDVAKGLEYLHHHTYAGPFIHKHLKSSNILLDIELHAQIAYFGVAKIREQMGMSAAAAESQGSSRSTPSTSGEQREQKGSCRLRSSTHSTFKQSHSIQISGRHGYMALEEKVGGLITPKLDVFAFGKELGRRLQAWMNPLLGDSAPLDYTLKTAELAKDCVDLDPNLRPNMSKVAFTLSKILLNSQAQEKSILAVKSLFTSMGSRTNLS